MGGRLMGILINLLRKTGMVCPLCANYKNCIFWSERFPLELKASLYRTGCESFSLLGR